MFKFSLCKRFNLQEMKCGCVYGMLRRVQSLCFCQSPSGLISGTASWKLKCTTLKATQINTHTHTRCVFLSRRGGGKLGEFPPDWVRLSSLKFVLFLLRLHLLKGTRRFSEDSARRWQWQECHRFVSLHVNCLSLAPLPVQTLTLDASPSSMSPHLVAQSPVISS